MSVFASRTSVFAARSSVFAAAASDTIPLLGPSLPPALSLTRASRAWAFDASGALQQREVNEAAFDFASGAPQGVECYGQITNYNSNPRLIGAVTGSPGTAPTNAYFNNDGVIAQTVVACGNGYIDINYSGTSATTFASRLNFSNYVPAVTGDIFTVSIGIYDLGGTGSVNKHRIVIEEIDNSYASIFSTYVDFTPAQIGKYLSIPVTVTKATTKYVKMRVLVEYTAGTTINKTIRYTYPSLTKTTFAPPIILPPEGTVAQSTRMPDVLRLTDAAFRQLLGSGTRFSIAAKFLRQHSDSAQSNVLRLDDGTDSNVLLLYASGTTLYGRATVGGVAGSAVALGTHSTTAQTAVALGVSGGAARGRVSGGADVQIGTGLPAMARCWLGNDATGAVPLNGNLQRLRAVSAALDLGGMM